MKSSKLKKPIGQGARSAFFSFFDSEKAASRPRSDALLNFFGKVFPQLVERSFCCGVKKGKPLGTEKAFSTFVARLKIETEF